jgi:hypothetical protein
MCMHEFLYSEKVACRSLWNRVHLAMLGLAIRAGMSIWHLAMFGLAIRAGVLNHAHLSRYVSPDNWG